MHEKGVEEKVLMVLEKDLLKDLKKKQTHAHGKAD